MIVGRSPRPLNDHEDPKPRICRMEIQADICPNMLNIVNVFLGKRIVCKHVLE